MVVLYAIYIVMNISCLRDYLLSTNYGFFLKQMILCLCQYFFFFLFYPDTGSKVSFNAHSVSLPVYERKSCAQIYGTSDIGKRVCAGYLYNGKGICKACYHFYVYFLTAADLLLHKTCKKKYNKM